MTSCRCVNNVKWTEEPVKQMSIGYYSCVLFVLCYISRLDNTTILVCAISKVLLMTNNLLLFILSTIACSSKLHYKSSLL